MLVLATAAVVIIGARGRDTVWRSLNDPDRAGPDEIFLFRKNLDENGLAR